MTIAAQAKPLTASELVAVIEELGLMMDAPDLTPEDEAEILEAMDLAEQQLKAIGLDFDGEPLPTDED